MDLQWSGAQQAIRAEYASIACRTDQDELRLGRRAFDQRTWDQLTSAGLWQMIVPEEYGGRGRSWWDFTAALEGLASGIRAPGLLLSVIAQAGMVRALDLFGTPAQKREYLGRILRGELSATAIADPDTGTDVRATSSVLSPGPNETFVLDGAKYNIAHAPVASFTLVVCKLAGHDRDGTALVLLDAGSEGLHTGPPDRKLGNLDLPTGPMRFDSVPLHYGNLLGTPGEGLRNLVSIVSLGRLYYGLAAAWLVEPMLAAAMDYARERQTFGVPVIEHQYVQKKLTDLRIAAETAKWTAYGALHQLLTGAPEAAMSCSIAKLAGAEAVTEGAVDLLKLYGSKGYHEGEVSTFLRDALAFCSVGGTEEMHRRNIIGQMTRLHAKSKRDVAPKARKRALETA
ncbi:acyl-CoA dehydrogenase family protein [Cribrihabitans neustonicus]|uniref:acyl-CoA dehydrogenase family protein n=1 Tax=Cribrihabitans neustonicus TaxID=1429085 RepID=UPI003B593D78